MNSEPPPKSPELEFRVRVFNRQKRHKIFTPSVRRFCAEILRLLNQPRCSLSVLFVGSRKMRDLNREFLGRDYATDVISFPYERIVVEGWPFLGEVVIAPGVVWPRSPAPPAPPEGEIRKLLTHGILHLLGYDHETDDGEMNRLQQGLLRRKALSTTPPIAGIR